MHRGWVLGLTLYVAFFAVTVGLRWRQFDQPYTDFAWSTAHSQLIVDNWLENGFWNERGLSFLNPPSIEFPSLLSRHPSISYPCGAQLPVYVLAKVFDKPVTPGSNRSAAIILKPGQSASEQELERYSLTKLSAFEVPKRFYFVKELPRTAKGAGDRRKLAAMFGGSSRREP